MLFEGNLTDFLYAVNMDTNSLVRFDEIRQKIEQSGYLSSVFTILMDVFNQELKNETSGELTRSSSCQIVRNGPCNYKVKYSRIQRDIQTDDFILRSLY